ncbi:MAG: helix-hairpin-helix domain-containing protein [Vulcanimicrobiaceae bacterium]
MKRIALVLVAALLIGLALVVRPPAPPAFASVAGASVAGASRAPRSGRSGAGSRRHGARFARRPRSSQRGSRSPRHQAQALVYVVGAVKRPGLYSLPADARVDAAVRRAGGLAAGADPAGVNLAAHLADGEQILVPRLGQRLRPVRSRRGTSTRRTRKLKVRPAPASVDPNRADAARLAVVPGLGPALARRIIALRRLNGPFATADELLDVAGMTPARLLRAEPYLRVP